MIQKQRYESKHHLLVLTGWLTGLLLIAAVPAADNTDPHAHHRQAAIQPASGSDASGKVELLPLQLLDQDGTARNFKTEIVGDRIVVMDFIYTTCTTVCPVQSAIFTQLQQALAGPLAQQQVRLISVSVDPVTDTPQRLKAYARRYRAGPHWRWLTGAKTGVDQVLQGLGAYTADFTDHPAMVLVGDAGSGTWIRFFGFPDPDRLQAEVKQLLAHRDQS